MFGEPPADFNPSASIQAAQATVPGGQAPQPPGAAQIFQQMQAAQPQPAMPQAPPTPAAAHMHPPLQDQTPNPFERTTDPFPVTPEVPPENPFAALGVPDPHTPLGLQPTTPAPQPQQAQQTVQQQLAQLEAEYGQPAGTLSQFGDVNSARSALNVILNNSASRGLASLQSMQSFNQQIADPTASLPAATARAQATPAVTEFPELDPETVDPAAIKALQTLHATNQSLMEEMTQTRQLLEGMQQQQAAASQQQRDTAALSAIDALNDARYGVAGAAQTAGQRVSRERLIGIANGLIADLWNSGVRNPPMDMIIRQAAIADSAGLPAAPVQPMNGAAAPAPGSMQPPVPAQFQQQGPIMHGSPTFPSMSPRTDGFLPDTPGKPMILGSLHRDPTFMAGVRDILHRGRSAHAYGS